jgi:hypothetical protein
MHNPFFGIGGSLTALATPFRDTHVAPTTFGTGSPCDHRRCRRHRCRCATPRPVGDGRAVETPSQCSSAAKSRSRQRISTASQNFELLTT